MPVNLLHTPVCCTLPCKGLTRPAIWPGAPAVAAAALRGWALVASTLPASRMGADWVERALGGLEAGLHAGDVDVRAAAGEAITLLFHSAGLAAADPGGAQPCGNGAQWNGAYDV